MNLRTALPYRLAIMGAICFSLALLCQTSCKKAAATAAAKQQETKLQNIQPEPKSDYEKLTHETRAYFLNGNYRAIEKRAANLRLKKERSPGGYWKLRAIYGAIVSPESASANTDGPDDQDWAAHFNRLKEWKEQFPESITASVALAQSYSRNGWNRLPCPCDKAKNTDVEKARFYQMLEMAAQELEAGARLKEKCPEWYLTMLVLAQIGKFNGKIFEAVFQQGVRYEPQYYYLYNVKAYNLHPYWGGKQGDWEKFADETSVSIGGREGSAVYYFIASSMFSNAGFDSLRQDVISWERVKQGYADVQSMYGADYRIANEFSFISFMANDSEAFCGALKEMENSDRDPAFWSEQKFVAYKQGCETGEVNFNRGQLAKGKMPPENEQHP